MSAGLHSALWHDAEIGQLFSREAELAAMLRFEAALAEAQAAAGLIGGEAALAIAGLCRTFVPDVVALEAGIARDGMAVPDLVRQLRDRLPESARDALHLRSTSQDVIDTVFMMATVDGLAIMERRLGGVISCLEAIGATDGDLPQMARTRMQRALPFTLAARVDAWRAPLSRAVARLADLRPRLLLLQTGGPIGIDDGPWTDRLAALLGLHVPRRSWHTSRDGLAELASWLSTVSGSLGKIGMDLAMMAQNEVGEAELPGGGKSSAMHHKSNPVPAEILVALARFNAVLVSGVHQALVHEQERSGAAWAIEWMCLPQMMEVTGASLRHAHDLLSRVRFPRKAP